jgi:hypothetical protein
MKINISGQSSSGGTITTQDEGGTLSTTVTTLNFVGSGVVASGAGDTTTVTISGGAGTFAVSEAEIDFGSTPQWDKTFTVSDASINSSHKIMVTPSGNVATSRVGDDWAWDGITFAALAGTGQFTLYAKPSPGPVVGRRKIFYTYS